MRRMSVMVRSICGSSSTTSTGSRYGSVCEDVIQNCEQFLGRERFLEPGVNEARRVVFAVAVAVRAWSGGAQDECDARADALDRQDRLLVRYAVDAQVENDRRRRFPLQRVERFLQAVRLERLVA